MLTKRRALLVLAGAAATVTRAARGETAAMPVVVTFSILADLTRNVGGARIAVTSLVGPNGDAHVFQPAPADAEKLAAARLVIVNGLNLEGWIDRLIKTAAIHAPVVVASRGVTPRQRSSDARGGIDPHAWQSVGNAEIYVKNIREGLIGVDPAGEAMYRANATAYLAKLAALDSEVKATIASIPPSRRRIITSHDAFGYFGAAYGLSFIAAEGLSTETEPSARDVAALIRQVKAQKVPAVFLENISDPRLMRGIAEESGAKLGGPLFSDALSPPGGPAGTYIAMIRHNITELHAALAG